jgi:hypothetical protein
MVLFDQHRKVAFFHVPKCAGRAVAQHLKDTASGGGGMPQNFEGILGNGEDIAHVTPENAHVIFGRALRDSAGREAGVTDNLVRILRDGLPGYFKFCFVRDPCVAAALLSPLPLPSTKTVCSPVNSTTHPPAHALA